MFILMVYLVKLEDTGIFKKIIGLASSGGIYKLNGDLYYQLPSQTIKVLNECGVKMEVYEARDSIEKGISLSSKFEKISIDSLPEIPSFMEEEHEDFKKSLIKIMNS